MNDNIRMERTHPLLNSDSTHYDNDGDMPDIYYMEKEFGRRDMIAWCRGNLFKYRARKDKKKEIDSDLKKIKTYENYMGMLFGLDRYSPKSVRELIDAKYKIDYLALN